MDRIGRWKYFAKWGLAGSVFLGTLTYAQESERFVVKVSSGNSRDPASRAKTRISNTQIVQNELVENVEGIEDTVALNKVGVLIVEGDPTAIKESLENNPLVEYVEKDITWKVSELTELSGLTAVPGDSVALPSAQSRNPWLDQFSGLTATAPAYDTPVPSGSDNVTVAVVDSGANYNHPYLANAIAVNSGEIANNNIDDDNNGYVDDAYGANVISYRGNVDSDSSHGTHVAGLVKTVRDQALGMNLSAAAKVRILPVKFISGGSGSTSAAITALNYAASRGAKVINCSWGAGGHSAFSQALYDTMVNLYNSDVVISVAAGNNGTNNDSTPYFPAGYNIPSLISVGSLTANFYNGTSISRSYFSNYGPNTVDVMAVGAMKDSYGDSGGVWSSYSSYIAASSYWVQSQGTSMAAPIVAGIAGVIRALNPGLNNYDVKQRIINTATASSESGNTKSGKRVHAASAFAATGLTSSGSRPGISGDAYYGRVVASDGDFEESSSRIGGCGLVLDAASKLPPPNQGPFGGNSMGLVTLLWFFFAAARKLQNKMAKDHT